MKKHKIITPTFYSRFKCSGPDCIDNCCKHWNITIDKKTYKKYQNSQHEKIRTFAKNNIIMLSKGSSMYSRVRLDKTGTCPMLNEEKLCSIHASMGANALSFTCKVFPRIQKRYHNETHNNLTLACPEVVNQVLFQPDSMLVEEEIILVNDSITQINRQKRLPDRNQPVQFVNLICRYLVMAESNTIEDNIFALAHFIIYLQKNHFQVENNYEDLESFFHKLRHELINGDFTQFRGTLKGTPSIKVGILTIFGKAINNTVRSKRYLVQNHQRIADFLFSAHDGNKTELKNKFNALHERWIDIMKSSCVAEEHVFKNYMLYHLYNSDFPGNDFSQILRKFYLLIADFFYLKTSLSVMSFSQDITRQDVMHLFSSHHAMRNHNRLVDKELNNYINHINMQDDLSCLLLIS
ncbi:hypothetical protein VL10_12940 [Leclercia adecarboxylata]|nr:hypothetical protein VL10_12940 [Leclercia adecarboxylata]KMN66814.1 hypothetical protein VK95_04255 [Leclercia sp. LK8]